LAAEESNAAKLLYSSMAGLDVRPSGPPGVAGLELRVALMLLQDDSGLPAADNDFWRAKCSALFLRPAVEPIACSYWARLTSFAFDEAAALHIASALAGRPLVYRKGPATGRSAGGDVGFEPLAKARRWLADLRAAAADPALRAALPAFAYARTIMAHPFADGNGRFARLMVHAALARAAGLDRPLVALAPACYRRGRALGEALTALGESGDWREFNALFLALLGDASALVKAFARTASGG
jgi:Fic/DOC family